MKSCALCAKGMAADHIGLCASCIRASADPDSLIALHAPLRIKGGFPTVPPGTGSGAACRLCANACEPGEGQPGFCGVRVNRHGRMESLAPPDAALAHAYLDPLPTNCCAAWFCRGCREPGYNLAVFFYGCNFDCLFCQNASHKLVRTAPVLTAGDLVARVLQPEVRCVCFFGGSPEPQFPFALRTAQRIAGRTGGRKPICWEWNGAGNEKLAERAARLSMETGGTVKFDLKAWHPNLQLALCGIGNARAFENFRKVAEICGDTDVLTATTLLVPYYVDAREVEALARFIAGINPDIPYSLLVFHPDYALMDLPVTPKKQAEECLDAARQHLTRVHIGNSHLLH